MGFEILVARLNTRRLLFSRGAIYQSQSLDGYRAKEAVKSNEARRFGLHLEEEEKEESRRSERRERRKPFSWVGKIPREVRRFAAGDRQPSAP